MKNQLKAADEYGVARADRSGAYLFPIKVNFGFGVDRVDRDLVAFTEEVGVRRTDGGVVQHDIVAAYPPDCHERFSERNVVCGLSNGVCAPEIEHAALYWRSIITGRSPSWNGESNVDARRVILSATGVVTGRLEMDIGSPVA